MQSSLCRQVVANDRVSKPRRPKYLSGWREDKHGEMGEECVDRVGGRLESPRSTIVLGARPKHADWRGWGEAESE